MSSNKRTSDLDPIIAVTNLDIIEISQSVGAAYESKKITFLNLKNSIGLAYHAINSTSHDTSATGAQLNTLTNSSNADLLHKHAHDSLESIDAVSSDRQHLTGTEHDLLVKNKKDGITQEVSDANSIHVHKSNLGPHVGQLTNNTVPITPSGLTATITDIELHLGGYYYPSLLAVINNSVVDLYANSDNYIYLKSEGPNLISTVVEQDPPGASSSSGPSGYVSTYDQILISRMTCDGVGVTMQYDYPCHYVDIHNILPAGMIAPFAMATPPDGWLECNATNVSRTQYVRLFEAIGTMYGVGDGSTTFTLPDYRGTFLRGWNHGKAGPIGYDPDAATRVDRGDGVIGDNVGTRQADELESHTHPIVAQDGVGTTVVGHAGTKSGAPILNHDGAGPTGGNETRPLNLYVMYCIKY